MSFFRSIVLHSSLTVVSGMARTGRKRLLERGSNREYWVDKNSYNIDRERGVNDSLSDLGWTVVRLWESAIHSGCARETQKLIEAFGDGGK
jgi:G:T-mismatch repair DNA endonuclease (very short patch repair protein)